MLTENTKTAEFLQLLILKMSTHFDMIQNTFSFFRSISKRQLLIIALLLLK